MYDMDITFFQKKVLLELFLDFRINRNLLRNNPLRYCIRGMKYASNVKILLNSKYYQENDIACMG